MDGCRVYRHPDPPREWRERLRLAREIVARCAPETTSPVLSLRGRGQAGLGDLPGSGLRVTDAILWGYVRPTDLRHVESRFAEWLRAGATVYLALDCYDESGWLHSGARAYCNPDPAKSTLMLTVPPHDRGEARRLLEGMLTATHAAGLFSGPVDAATAESLLSETKESVPLAGLEVRPIRTGDHPHMYRLAGDRCTSERLIAALEGCLPVLGAPGRIYLKLQGTAPAVSAVDGLAFEDPPYWRVRAELPPEAELDRHLWAAQGTASATFEPLRFSGQVPGRLSELVVGLSRPLLTVTVDFQQDGDAVERALRDACPVLERSADMPFE